MSTDPGNSSTKDSYFYHTVEFPDGSKVTGEWDLRDGVDDYLGHVDFTGKRVLDAGTASGFLSFAAEKRGASEVVSYDLDPDGEWDVVPYAGVDFKTWISERKEHIRKIRNGYWECHRAFQSKATLVQGSIYDLAKKVEPVDISIVGSILLHLQDPWSALRNILAVTREKVVIVEMLPRRYFTLKYFRNLDLPWLTFLPDHRRQSPIDSWWVLTPAAIRRMIGVLGFEQSEIQFHKQPFQGKMKQLYTIVAARAHSISPTQR